MLTERIVLLGSVLLYLLHFDQVLVHGDALRVVGQIETGHLVWNPNHLLFDPIGYAIVRAAGSSGSASALAIFEMISVIATLVSLFIFHALLIRIAVRRTARVILFFGLFASASFLALSGSQYYFMVQMPFLVSALYLHLDFVERVSSERIAYGNLYGMGVLLALATAIMINNLFLVVGAGVAVAFCETSLRRPRVDYSVRLFFAASLVGFPLFMIGYVLSSTDAAFIQWLRSYAGDSKGALDGLYGIKWTVAGVAESTARTAFNYALGNLVEHAGFGTVLWIYAFGQPVEFVPQWGRITLSSLAILPTVLITTWVALHVLRRWLIDPVTRGLAVWLLAFVTFNLFWNCNEEIFWFQILPAFWILLAISLNLQLQIAPTGQATRSAGTRIGQKLVLLGAYVGLILIVNTNNLTIPLADTDHYKNQSRHAALLEDGDLEIVPGWDRQKWMSLPAGAPVVQQVTLMSLVIAGGASGNDIKSLPRQVREHIDGGGRVVVARLFDIDTDLMPWYALQRLGWPRARIQELLTGYCTREIERVGGVVFRELYQC